MIIIIIIIIFIIVVVIIIIIIIFSILYPTSGTSLALFIEFPQALMFSLPE